jgi:hypothetical protein
MLDECFEIYQCDNYLEQRVLIRSLVWVQCGRARDQNGFRMNHSTRSPVPQHC